MKDIDFDELDRAVNSLMNNVPTDTDDNDAVTSSDIQDTPVSTGLQPTALVQDDAATVAVHDEIQLAPHTELMIIEDEESEGDNAPVEPASAASVSPTTTSLPPVRRGKFMDMVRPPIREAEKTASSAMPSRHAPTLQPITPQPRPKAVADPVAGETTAPVDSWQADDSLQKELEATLAPSQPSITPLDSGPQVLPFLPDAKVEKRPLGRPVEAQPAASLSEPSLPVSPLSSSPLDMSASPNQDTVTATQDEEDAQLPGQPLPAELGSELLSIETSTDMLPPETPMAMPAHPAQPASSSLHIPGVARPSAATSIPQQYTLQPKEAEDQEPAGAIYDAATYHQPLVHTANKKPGWVWIVAILVILLLGITGGAALYYFGLGG